MELERRMKMRSSDCTDVNSSSTPRSKASGRSGRSGRSRLVIRSKPKAGLKSASSSGRRLSNLVDRLQCEPDCPPADSRTGEGVDAEEASEELPETPVTDAPPEAQFEKSKVTIRPADCPIQWPDEAARKKDAKAGKHIHPCICDLSKRQRANIEDFLKERRAAQQRYERRVQEIEEEIRLAEEAEQQRLREKEAEKEFYGDEYEMEGSKRKRKKRSARRASMVSLGVKQVINWRKPPKIEVRFTRASNLRAINSTYCKPPMPPLPQIRPVDVNIEQPEIPIRATRTVELRLKFTKSLMEAFRQRQVKVRFPDRPPFVTQYYW